jgi:hypothetical protein
MKFTHMCYFLLVFGFLAGITTAGAQTVETLLAEAGSVRNFTRVTISPDGKKVAWVEIVHATEEGFIQLWVGTVPVGSLAGQNFG